MPVRFVCLESFSLAERLIVSLCLLFVLGCSTTGAPPAASPGVAQVSVTLVGLAQTRLGQTTQFTASVANTSNQAVTWQVNGVPGGSAATGTISAAGLYTAPSVIPTPDTVTVAAISAASATASASISESIWNPVPIIGSATATTLGTSTPYLVDVRGMGYVAGAQIQVAGSSLTTSLISSSELQASYVPASGVSAALIAVLNPAPGASSSSTVTVQLLNVNASVTAASRLLDQATFGPTLSEIQHVQAVGLNGYLTEQFATPATLLPDLPNPLPSQCFPSNPRPCEQSEWWAAAMTGSDQLRQRVALALSEMMVVSTNSISPYAVLPYQNLLAQDAFGNFATVMKDVTLSTAMGGYLNMLNSAKPPTGQIANENYPRELMQLFTIGLNQLNQDGTPKLDSAGNFLPTYTQAQVQAFARAFTGWTYASSTGGIPARYPNTTVNYDSPMAQVESYHDTSVKTLLGGTTLPAGQTSAQDLDGALLNLFNHANVAPFVCKQLIQHLVSSNPSPAYVSRVASVFNNNGAGVRGDLKSVVSAILLDAEARAGDTNPTFNGGHLREPILYLTGVMRGLGFVNTDPSGYFGTLTNYSSALSESPYASPSVFNFFPPSYIIPGTSTSAPEFALENTATAILRLTQANQLVYSQISGFHVDLSATSALGLMAANPGNLVDSLGIIFMHGQMPIAMRTAIVNHISTFTDPAQRARVATFLVITSSLYKVEN